MAALTDLQMAALMGASTVTGAPVRTKEYVLEHCGVSYDGSTDNTPVLLGIRNEMLSRQSSGEAEKFVFRGADSGTCQYESNRWAYGLKYVTLKGGVYQCTSASPWDRDKQQLYLVDPLDGIDPEHPYTGAHPVTQQALVASCSVGATSVTALNVAELDDFEPGEYILHGFDRQFGGFPPNPRYLDRIVVSDINKTTGVINFTPPLQNSYDDRWPQGSLTGPPTLVQLNRPNAPICEQLTLQGATFLVNAIDGRDTIYLVCKDLLIEGMTSPDVDITFGWSESAVVRNCDLHDIEVDKLLDTVLIEDTVLDRIAEATGARDLTLRRVEVDSDGFATDSVTRISPINLTLDDCTLRNSDDITNPQSMYMINVWSVQSIDIQNTDFISTRTSPAAAILNSPVREIPVESVGAGNSIQIASAARENVFRSVEIGDIIWDATTGNSGAISAMYEDGANWVIEGSWTAAPVVGQSWLGNNIKAVTTSGSTLSGHSRLLQDPMIVYPGQTGQSVGVPAFAFQGSGTKTFQLRSFPQSLSVTVNSAVAGSQVFLAFVLGDDVTTVTVRIDGSQVGTRTINSSGSTGALGVDDLLNGWAGQYVRRMQVSHIGTDPDLSANVTIDGV